MTSIARISPVVSLIIRNPFSQDSIVLFSCQGACSKNNKSNGSQACISVSASNGDEGLSDVRVNVLDLVMTCDASFVSLMMSAERLFASISSSLLSSSSTGSSTKATRVSATVTCPSVRVLFRTLQERDDRTLLDQVCACNIIITLWNCFSLLISFMQLSQIKFYFDTIPCFPPPPPQECLPSSGILAIFIMENIVAEIGSSCVNVVESAGSNAERAPSPVPFLFTAASAVLSVRATRARVSDRKFTHSYLGSHCSLGLASRTEFERI